MKIFENQTEIFKKTQKTQICKNRNKIMKMWMNLMMNGFQKTYQCKKKDN